LAGQNDDAKEWMADSDQWTVDSGQQASKTAGKRQVPSL
jgi:hypothetical protein